MAAPTVTSSANPTVPTTATTAPQATSEALILSAKRSAAYHAVDTHYPTTPVDFVGIGSGSTVVFVVERISQLPPSRTANTFFIPTGFQSKQLLLRAGLKVAEVDLLPPGAKIAVCFDGADEIDFQLNCIKGGGACLFQEKLVAVSSNEFICVADFRKISKNLLTPTTWESGVPIEVLPLSYMYVSSQLVTKLGASATILRSGGKAKAGPCVTDNGNFIIDAKWPTLLGQNVDEVQTLAEGIKRIVGVVDHGLFYGGSHGWAGRPMKAYFGMEDGGVKSLGPEGFIEVLKGATI